MPYAAGRMPAPSRSRLCWCSVAGSRLAAYGIRLRLWLVVEFLRARGYTHFVARLKPVFVLLQFSFLLSVAAAQPQTLPGTKPLELQGDLSFQMQEQVDAFLTRKLERSAIERQSLWNRDYSSAEKYIASVQSNRSRFRHAIGVVDQRLPARDLHLVATLNTAALVAETERLRIYAVRWPVFDGVDGEGLLLEPKGAVRAQIVAIPDADWTPEMAAGLSADLAPASQFARRLAEAGCRVLVPVVMDRGNTWSGSPRVRMTNQSHREFIYRQAYFLGRHLIGYEVQKILAAVDYFKHVSKSDVPVGVAGYGEGGLLALYSAAVDQRIDAALVGGYFQQREKVWQEPVERNVWGLLHEFGDAEIASLILPRALVIEACRGPEVPGPPPPRDGRQDAASGVLTTPAVQSVEEEFKRTQQHYDQLGLGSRLRQAALENGKGPPGSEAALAAFLELLGLDLRLAALQDGILQERRPRFDSSERMKRQYHQLVDYTQRLMHLSPFRREEFWSKADASSIETWRQSTRSYREYFWKEVIGWLPAADLPPNPRTRLIYDTPKWRGYEVVLDVWPSVITYGILLVPKDLKVGEKRPVVVAQHGRAGRPQDVCSPFEDTQAYHSFGARLADRGFVVYAPQNLYIGEETYRVLQRKANPLKLTIFAPMVRQHEQSLDWLGSLPFVDADRIGFYGLSYGGKSAMFIPAVLEGYALSICSGDFNEEVWKHVSIEARYSFMFTKEHEHTEFDFGEKFNYAELASLIAPRPFMVERGHRDGVAPDEWVAYEYAKVRRRYVALGIGDRTEIEFFNGVHEIHKVGTFRFLQKHLRWPEP
ncbi:MAG: dienelactone hydrolase family protein [Acidobacteriota bacterium]